MALYKYTDILLFPKTLQYMCCKKIMSIVLLITRVNYHVSLLFFVGNFSYRKLFNVSNCYKV